MVNLHDTEKQLLFQAHQVPFAQCHASTLLVLPNDEVIVAYFAGTKEGENDVGIWLSRQTSGRWLAPIKIIDNPNTAHWNPVLHFESETIWLFFKSGADVQQWTTEFVTSKDFGQTWSAPLPLVEGSLTPRGPVKNKLTRLSNGDWLAPNSIETCHHWDASCDRSTDQGKHWDLVPIPLKHYPPELSNSDSKWQGLVDGALWETEPEKIFAWDGVIQPCIWESTPANVHMLMRSTRGRIYRSDSSDYGNNWCEAYATPLPNNNSGIDIVRFDDVLALIYNPVSGNWAPRTPLSLSFSQDNGSTWCPPVHLETRDGEYSYPAIIYQNNCLHITYTDNRKTIIYQRIKIDI